MVSPAHPSKSVLARTKLAKERDQLDRARLEVVTKPSGQRWSVYVLEVIGLGPGQVYVGQSWFSPEHRRQQHIDGIKSARIFKRPGVAVGALRPDLIARLPRLESREAAETAEANVASHLRQRGLTVHGGH